MESFAALFTYENLAALAALAGLEIVLGIDNIVFLAIVTAKLPVAMQARARQVGLLAAMGMRIALLLCVSWIMGLKGELFSFAGHTFSGKDLILLGGGLFLVGKATYEIHHKLEAAGVPEAAASAKSAASFSAAIAQVMVIDLVFSLDSVITAVGMVKHVEIMIAAIVISVGVMMIAAGPVSAFVERHPTLKMLALSFLVLIGVLLVAEGFHQHINRGYVYFAMAFALIVEMLNIRAFRKAKPAQARAGTSSSGG